MIITENRLDEWVRGNARKAQGIIVELVYRLVAAASPKPKERRFPLGDSIGQRGPDGILDTDLGFEPFVPEGRSFWEIGTGIDAGRKATADYKSLVETIPEEVRLESSFIFVTPLSGRRDWPNTWDEDAQAKWLKDRRGRQDWQKVQVIDGSRLIDWLHFFPAVERWLAFSMGIPIQRIRTPEQHWTELRTIGYPPPLTPDIFITGREVACEKLKEIFARDTFQLMLETRYPDQVTDFIAGYIETMDEDSKIDTVGRCLFVNGVEAWDELTAIPESHVLVVDFDIDGGDSAGTRLLEKARRKGHAVIFRGMPGGIPHPNHAPIPNPKSYQIKEALVKAGYEDERARTLAQKSAGNLGSLLRLLQNLSLMPEWAQGTQAADLAIAAFLGEWTESSEADRTVVETLSGKSYGEWIGEMRDITLRPGTPLIQRDGAWKFVSRYEGWYALGPQIFDEHLDRLKNISINVLRELDPKFELSEDKRFSASLYGKVLTHSRLLRKGLAECLALLGSHPEALTSCSSGKAETIAALSVREILAKADWHLWASLNDLLPLLAEAAPREFLDAVEYSLEIGPSPFDSIFAEEGSGITGSNYMTGLLWALETLAWDPAYLTRVIMILGGLASIDPGGKWANRPANSLTAILLPWLPQTCAPMEKRLIAVTTLLSEIPNVAWRLLLSLLPQSHQMSSYTRKPVWRETIPSNWTERVTQQDFWAEIAAYTELAITEAKRDLTKLIELIQRLDDLPDSARNQLLEYLASEEIRSIPQEGRLRIWTELLDLITNHRRFSDASWAMEPAEIEKVAEVAEILAPDSPFYLHQRLFNEREFDLFDHKGDYEDQRKQIEIRRQDSLREVFSAGGIETILQFAETVESPWRVGWSFGVIAPDEIDGSILPKLLNSESESMVMFAGGYIRSRFNERKWDWVDRFNMNSWNPHQKAQFLAFLPFCRETWDRANNLLAENEAEYWSRTTANPYEAKSGLDWAIDRLIEFGRPHAALKCVEKLRHDKQPIGSQQIIKVLKAILKSSEDLHLLDVHAIVEAIKTLQDDPSSDPEDVYKIEWAFLGVLDRNRGSYPKLLERRLAENPSFFCEVIQAVFRSDKEEGPAEESTVQDKDIAKNAFRLLMEWQTPPGSQPDGTYNGEKLKSWIQEVKEICTESGHLGVASSRIGHVLVYSPPDPDGLWIHQSAARVLNEKDASSMREGFRIELFNSRGVHSWTGGQGERELATKYREQAEGVEMFGYHRLADSLRELAGSYERAAEREATRDLFES